MHKFAALGLAVAVALVLTVGLAKASEPSDGLLVEPSGVSYEWDGCMGMVTLSGMPGTPFEVFDATGLPVFAGVLEAPSASFPVPNVGCSPDGTILTVRLGDDILAITDPGWQWD